MRSPLGNALKAARTARGLTAQQVGDIVGISGAAVYQWESGRTKPDSDNLIKVAEFLGIDPVAAGRGDLVEVGSPAIVSNPPLPDVTLPPPGQEQFVQLPEIGNRDIEVKGTGVGGDDADFRMNGETVDRIPRPPGIAHKRGVFAIFLQKDSMYPALKHGDPLYLDPNRRPAIGEDVVVELYGSDGEPGDAFVKRLVRRSGSRIVVEQFNPPKEIEFDMADVRQVLRIIPWTELIGS